METELNGFDEFWKVYPRRVGKLSAVKAYKRALRVTTPDRIIDGAKAYAKKRAGEDATYTKHPATWLNGGCWDDDVYKPGQITAAIAKQCNPKVLVREGTEQWKAWCRYLGKTPPMNRQFGWYFDDEWPPLQAAE